MMEVPGQLPAPRILVIDDDEGVRSTLEILLEEEGLEVLTARDGNYGLDLFSAHRVDLVITDMQMPSKGGGETISEIRRKNPRIPIIAMSGSNKSIDGGELAATGIRADHMIEKPFDYDDLLALVRALLPARRDIPGRVETAGI